MRQGIRALKEKTIGFVSKNPKLTVLASLLFIAVFVYVNIELLHYTSEPSFCEKCHPKQGTGPLTEVYTWKRSLHASAGIECLDCHGRPGFFGYMRAKLGGLHDVYSELLKSREHMIEVLKKAAEPAYAAKIVPNETCLFCHSDGANQKIRKERLMSVGITFRKLDGVINPAFRQRYGLPDVLTEDVRPDADVAPRHAKHMEKGLNCVDCHVGIVHSGEKENKLKMQTCFDCHDKMRAQKLNPPANENCTDCHRKSEGIYPRKPIVYKPAGTAPVSFSHEFHTGLFGCDRCHPGIWPMKKGAKKMTMEAIFGGKYCGACHNDKVAFAAATSCDKCHVEQAKK